MSTNNLTTSKMPTSWEIAYNHLRALIFSHEKQPGDILSEHKIATELGVSKVAVREALHRLELEGLIYTSNRRKRVYLLTIKDIEEIFDLKKVIESNVARWAAERGEDKELVELKQVASEMMEMSKKRSFNAEELEQWNTEWTELDVKYHQILRKMGRNSRAQKFLEILNVPWYKLRIGILVIEGRIENSAIEHNQIADAIANRDANLAEKCMNRHWENTKQILVNVMRTFHFPET